MKIMVSERLHRRLEAKDFLLEQMAGFRGRHWAMNYMLYLLKVWSTIAVEAT